jgi:hypothetical protein
MSGKLANQQAPKSTSKVTNSLRGRKCWRVLGPFLFVIFIKDISEVATWPDVIKKFADDPKLGQRMTTERKMRLHEALDTH